MAFGRTLNQDDSDDMRTALKDPLVVQVTFHPSQEGHAVYVALEWFHADESYGVVGTDDPRFEPAFKIVLEHDYPSEFNDKFFVELAPAGGTKSGPGTGWTLKTIKVADLKPGDIIHPSDSYGPVLEADQRGPIMHVSTTNRPFCGWPADSDIEIEVPPATSRS